MGGEELELQKKMGNYALLKIKNILAKSIFNISLNQVLRSLLSRALPWTFTLIYLRNGVPEPCFKATVRFLRPNCTRKHRLRFFPQFLCYSSIWCILLGRFVAFNCKTACLSQISRLQCTSGA